MEDRKRSIYFIGIALPSALDESIMTLKRHLQDNDDHALVPLVPHITLLHPPSLRGIMPEELVPKVHDIAKRYLPLTISLESIEFFDDTTCYIRARSAQLESLQPELVKLLPSDIQALHYTQSYIPHVTLLQVHEPHRIDILQTRHFIEQHLELPLQFRIDSVSHFRWIRPREYRSEAI